MKLDIISPNLESFGQLDEKFFAISDLGIIFEILRNKLYSNPILAACREYSCNARDAHREVGKFDEPIIIHLPNNLEPYYKVKDFGPGISPDRMENIFIKYTASSKRNDNVQTGAFGLGGKVGFSVSDSFSIITNHEGIKYNYSCNIDETKVGKLILLSQESTSEQNGTEIIIPVKNKNFKDFATWTEQACRHWDIKPIVKGGTINWETINKIIEGDKWTIIKTDSWQGSSKMIIDGIEYPLEIDSLRKYADTKLIDAARGTFIMYFGIGELSLSANRESIYLDEKTQNIIRNRLLAIQNEIKQKVVERIESFPDLYLANVYFRKELVASFNDIKFLGPMSWRGIPLYDGYATTVCPTFTFIKGKYSRKHGTDPNKLSKSSNNYFVFEESSEIYLNDLPLKEPTPRHIKKAFENDPKLKSVQVICPKDDAHLLELNKKIHLDQMNPKLLSSITKASRAYTSSANRLIVFKFDNSNFRQVSYSSLEEDTNSKVICLLKKNSYSYASSSRTVTLENNRILEASALKSLSVKFPKYSFYGVDIDTPADRMEEEFSDFENIEDFLQNKIIDNKNVNYVEIKFALKYKYQLDNEGLQALSMIKGKIKNQNSFYLKRLNLHNKIKEINVSESNMLHLYESINGCISDAEIDRFIEDNPTYDIKKMDIEYEQKYSLLAHISTYKYSEIVSDIAQYINLIDSI